MDLKRNNMKKLAGFIVILAVFVLGAYYAMGFVVQRTLDKHVKAITPNPYYTVTLDKYERGWFCSRGVLGMKINLPAQNNLLANGQTQTHPKMDIQLNLPIRVSHGPFIFGKTGLRFGIAQVTTQPETHYGFFVNYLNRSVINYALPAFSMDSQSGNPNSNFHSDWKGLNAMLSVSPDIDDAQGDFTMLGLHIVANQVDLNLGEIEQSFNLNRSKEGLWLGDSHLRVPAISVKGDNGQQFVMNGLELLGKSYVADDALNFNLELSLQDLVVNNETFGPGNLKLSLTQLEPVAMANIYKQLGTLSNNGNSNLTMLAIMAELPKLVSKGSQLEFSETLKVPEGQIVGNLSISLPKSEGGDPSQVFAKVQGSGQFRAPMATVKEAIVASINSNGTAATSQQSAVTPGDTATAIQPVTTVAPVDPQTQADNVLKKLVDKGVLTVDGSDYLIQFKVENQQLMVNGKPFDPSMLNVDN
jgi:uncharacterized protein YdgA (DUF945 family)